MTIDRTLPPPNEPVYFTCSKVGCENLWAPYHGKTGCECYDCDKKTPERMRLNIKHKMKKA